MDAESIPSIFASLQIPANHTSLGLSNLLASNSQTKSLFHHKRLPDHGWSDVQILRLLYELSVLDTNCEETVKVQLGHPSSSSRYPHRWTGAGEREGRIYSPLVSQRHYGLGHGIGRSGDVLEAQPKAVGSSALLRLTIRLALDAVRRGSGLNGSISKTNNNNGPAAFGTILPVCTGMSLSLVLSSLRNRAISLDQSAFSKGFDEGVSKHERTIVLWSRIDQKSCFKAILTTGLKCIVLPTLQNPMTDEVSTDLTALQDALDTHSNSILAVLTTTSCFCPRVPDEVDKVAKLLLDWNKNKPGAGIAHVINHAYGLQCQVTNKLINRACAIGRVDAIICSTDKNFLVPVGGALIISPDSKVLEDINRNYPGRASASPIVDLFITLMSMGLNGYKAILEERKRLVELFRKSMEKVADKFGERVLDCPRNTISFGMTLNNLANHNVNINDRAEKEFDTTSDKPEDHENINSNITKFGSMLFTRCISGTRVVPLNSTKSISGHVFQGFGSSNDCYPHAYLTAACALGLGEQEMEEFFIRLENCCFTYRGLLEKESKKR